VLLHREMRLLIRTLHQGDVSLDVDTEITVDEVKERIAEKFPDGVFPVDRQRLIHKGRALVGNDTLLQLGIGEGMVIHVVARPEGSSPRTSESLPVPSTPPTQLPQSQALMDLNTTISRLFPPLQLAPSGASSSSSASSSSTPALSPSFEPMWQNMLTVHTLLSTFNSDGGSGGTLEGQLPYAGIQLYEGQWVDCLDTVENWLEATVLRVDHANRTVYITFNGWPDRWNEWLPFTSSRIAPFRSHSRHNSTSRANLYSPTVVAPYANAPRIASRSTDPNSLLFELARLVRSVQPMLDESADLFGRTTQSESVGDMPPTGSLPWSERSSTMSHISETTAASTEGDAARLTELSAQLCPVLDRLGRLLIDTSQRISESSQTPSSRPAATDAFRQPINSSTVEPFSLHSNGSVDLHIAVIPLPRQTVNEMSLISSYLSSMSQVHSMSSSAGGGGGGGIVTSPSSDLSMSQIGPEPVPIPALSEEEVSLPADGAQMTTLPPDDSAAIPRTAAPPATPQVGSPTRPSLLSRISRLIGL